MLTQTKLRKHTPLRSCVVCRERFSKRELTRIVRTPIGSVEIDRSGKKNGRGAYLCSSAACWEQALVKRRLDYALRGRISEVDRSNILRHARVG
jgi:predicted RNA-binding protein YlxR (DUF448 family)